MKKITFICFAFLAIGVTGANAQGILDKIDRAVNKADRASNTADRAGKTSGKIGSLFGKKKDAADVSADTKTTINISGITFAALKNVNENVQASKGVANSKMKFNASGSTIIVEHGGSSEDLLKILQKSSPTIFSEQNIDALEEGQISVKIKK